MAPGFSFWQCAYHTDLRTIRNHPILQPMRCFAALVMLLAFLFNAPGIHARDVMPGHEHVLADMGAVDCADATPAADHQHGMDAHHSCSHIHIADHVRLTQISEPAFWGPTLYRADSVPLPASAEPRQPEEPPRA